MAERFYDAGCGNKGWNKGFRVPVWRGNIGVFFIGEIEEGCALMTFDLEAIDDMEGDGSRGRVVGHPLSLRSGILTIDKAFKKLRTMYFYNHSITNQNLQYNFCFRHSPTLSLIQNS